MTTLELQEIHDMCDVMYGPHVLVHDSKLDVQLIYKYLTIRVMRKMKYFSLVLWHVLGPYYVFILYIFTNNIRGAFQHTHL
jgi:hypothetical protein